MDPQKTDLDDYDIRALTRLAKRVNVIPVIGKSDSLTLAQRSRLKPTLLRSIYNKHKIPLYGMPEEEEEEEDSDDDNATKDNNTKKKDETLAEFLQQFDYDQEEDEIQVLVDYLRTIPFTFIACEEDPTTGTPLQMTSATGKQIQLGRDYGWGTIDCQSDDYSDFNKLITVLFCTHRRLLITETVERYYEQYRTERLMQRRITKMKSMEVNKKFLEDLKRL